MGNACIQPGGSRGPTKLVFFGGATRFVPEKLLAGELMAEFPDHVVCHANSLYIGHPVPVLSIEDELRLGQTYFVFPIDCFPCRTLTVAAVAALASGRKGSPMGLEYVKGLDGRTLIQVSPEFMAHVFGEGCGRAGADSGCRSLCSTPELRRHYEQLVGSRDRPWSPTLQTISEGRLRASPGRLLGWSGLGEYFSLIYF